MVMLESIPVVYATAIVTVTATAYEMTMSKGKRFLIHLSTEKPAKWQWQYHPGYLPKLHA